MRWLLVLSLVSACGVSPTPTPVTQPAPLVAVGPVSVPPLVVSCPDPRSVVGITGSDWTSLKVENRGPCPVSVLVALFQIPDETNLQQQVEVSRELLTLPAGGYDWRYVPNPLACLQWDLYPGAPLSATIQPGTTGALVPSDHRVFLSPPCTVKPPPPPPTTEKPQPPPPTEKPPYAKPPREPSPPKKPW